MRTALLLACLATIDVLDPRDDPGRKIGSTRPSLKANPNRPYEVTV